MRSPLGSVSGLRTATLMAAASLLLIVVVSPAAAAVFKVNDLQDGIDAAPGDGFCKTAAGRCTLRAAIAEANAYADVAGPDLVYLPAGTHTVTIAGANEDAGATGDLDITDSLSLIGSGSDKTTVSGGGDAVGDRVLDIHGLVNVRLEGMTIRNGRSGAANGGGILSNGSLTISRCRIVGNRTDQANSHSGGGVFSAAGGLAIVDSEILDNAAYLGGGLYVQADAAVIENTVIEGNRASHRGGGVYVSSTGLDVRNSLVSANAAADNGGGIFQSLSAAAYINSTISGNLAGASGGGLYVQLGGPVQTANITITDNAADSDRNGSGDGGGVAILTPGWIYMKNAVLAGNDDPGKQAPDCSGAIWSQRHNVFGNIAGCSFKGDTDGDQTGVDAELDILADNGGSTRTHALLPGSPAIDGGNAGGCVTAEAAPILTDQRGFGRPADGDGDGRADCDAGAFEAQ
ncbi:MAG: hypothetical protein HYV63_30330 [Candidatus Schekmanbacteria bacterium]|nr:hypothetical protein [Candidatus Schekmanbacteria bacterium]